MSRLSDAPLSTPQVHLARDAMVAAMMQPTALDAFDAARLELSTSSPEEVLDIAAGMVMLLVRPGTLMLTATEWVDFAEAMGREP